MWKEGRKEGRGAKKREKEKKEDQKRGVINTGQAVAVLLFIDDVIIYQENSSE